MPPVATIKGVCVLAIKITTTKYTILTNEVSLRNVCNVVLMAKRSRAHWCFVSKHLQLSVFIRFFMFVWLRWLTCICFCGCDVWVAAGSAFSRGPRALSLPSELIIYSIYKTLYVQNRKICKGNKMEGRVKSTNSSYTTDLSTTHTLHLQCCKQGTFPCVSA